MSFQIYSWYKKLRRNLKSRLAANLFLNDLTAVLTSKTFQAILAVAATFYAYQSAVISTQAIRISQCQELKQAAESPVRLLSGFLLDPHVENFGWDFHNGVAAEFGSGSALRRTIGRPFRADVSVCQADGSTWSYINPQFEDMRLRIVSWNVNGLGKTAGRTDYLRLLKPDLVLLQEVTPALFQILKSENFFASIACSLELCAGQEVRKRPLGCVIASTQLPLTNVALLSGMPIAERALVGQVQTGQHLLDVCSFHAPPGVNWGDVKSTAYSALAEWLVDRSGPTALGMDGNSPKVDHPDHAKSIFWRDHEDSVLGVDAKHRLKDSYRTFLEQNAATMGKIREQRPDGPLAISYDRGKATSVPCRYDFLFASPELRVRHVDHHRLWVEIGELFSGARSDERKEVHEHGELAGEIVELALPAVGERTAALSR
jgi:hypothetical protein